MHGTCTKRLDETKRPKTNAVISGRGNGSSEGSMNQGLRAHEGPKWGDTAAVNKTISNMTLVSR